MARGQAPGRNRGRHSRPQERGGMRGLPVRSTQVAAYARNGGVLPNGRRDRNPSVPI
jgi:hypothetical protein